MKAITKPAVFLMIYFVLFGMTSMAIATIKNNTTQLVLHILCLVFHLTICVVISFMEAKKAMKVRIQNDKVRLRIIETGENLQYDKSSEYKISNGILMAFIVCLPLIVFTLANAISFAITGRIAEMLKIASNFVCGTTFRIFSACGISETISYILPASAFVVYAIFITIGYYLGGKKYMLINERFEETKQKINGDMF